MKNNGDLVFCFCCIWCYLIICIWILLVVYDYVFVLIVNVNDMLMGIYSIGIFIWSFVYLNCIDIIMWIFGNIC